MKRFMIEEVEPFGAYLQVDFVDAASKTDALSKTCIVLQHPDNRLQVSLVTAKLLFEVFAIASEQSFANPNSVITRAKKVLKKLGPTASAKKFYDAVKNWRCSKGMDWHYVLSDKMLEGVQHSIKQ